MLVSVSFLCLYLIILFNVRYGNQKYVENVRDKELNHKIAKSLRGGLSGVHGPKEFTSDGESLHTPDDVFRLYEISATQHLAVAESKFDEYASLETEITTPDDSEIGYKVELDLKHCDNVK